MAISSVADFSSFINRQIDVQEEIESCLWQIEALIAIAVMTEGFYEFPENILQNYFSVARDLIEVISKANQTSLSELLKAKPVPIM